MRNAFAIGISAIVSLAAGSATTYFLIKKQLEAKYEQLAAKEIAEAKQFYAALYKREEFSSPLVVASELLGDVKPDLKDVVDNDILKAAVALRSYQGSEPVGNSARNVFDHDGGPDDNLPDPADQDVPYVIKQSTYMENDVGHTQCTLTYFAGDQTLVDEREQIVDDVDDMVGEDNLERFGQKSKDPNVVYVRNDVTQMDFEILLSQGKYSEEVAGLGG